MSNWIWMGRPAHFIGANECQFRLATVVGNGKWIVSTVGDYLPQGIFDSDGKRRKPLELGWKRLYETMVFKAKKQPHDACCPFHAADGSDLDMIGYMTDREATEGHVDMCHKWDMK